MKLYHLFTLATLMCSYACSTASTNFDQMPDRAYKKSFPLDLDDNGTTDAHITYDIVSTLDIPPSSGGASLVLFGTDSCRFLCKSDENQPFFAPGEMLPSVEQSSTRYLYSQMVRLADKSWSSHGWQKGWNSTWTEPLQYLPFRIYRERKAYYGWLEISVHTKKGRIIIHDSYCSSVAEQRMRMGEKEQ